MNDRHRVEIMLICAALWSIMEGASPDPGESSEKSLADYNNVMQGLESAANEPVDGLADAHANKLRRRALRAARVIEVESNGQTIAKSALAMYYLIEGLIQEGKIEVWEGSPFGDAMTALMESVSRFIHGKEKVDRSAEKMARRIREKLGREGYFN